MSISVDLEPAGLNELTMLGLCSSAHSGSDSYLFLAGYNLILDPSLSRILLIILLDSSYLPSSSHTGSLPTRTRVLSPRASQSLMFSITSSLAASISGEITNAIPASFGTSRSENCVILKGIFPSITLSPLSSRPLSPTSNICCRS